MAKLQVIKSKTSLTLLERVELLEKKVAKLGKQQVLKSLKKKQRYYNNIPRPDWSDSLNT